MAALLTPLAHTPLCPLQVCAVYCLDSQFVTEANKFIAGSLQVLMTSQHVVKLCVLDEVSMVTP